MGVAGAACDTFTGAEVVMADGRVLNMTADRDADLMWALRGAGANFGIVTRLTYRAYPLNRVFGGSLIFPSAAAGELLSVLNALSASAPDELCVFGQIVYEPTQDALVRLTLCWAGDSAHGRDVIAQQITSKIRPIKDSMKDTTLAQLTGNEISPPELQCTRYAMWRASCRRAYSIDSSTAAARPLRCGSFFLTQSMARSLASGRM